jgi:hypothetical protein
MTPWQEFLMKKRKTTRTKSNSGGVFEMYLVQIQSKK